MINSKAKWIWISDNPKSEEYGFFKESFMYENGKVVLKIAAETDYIAYINGKMVSFRDTLLKNIMMRLMLQSTAIKVQMNFL